MRARLIRHPDFPCEVVGSIGVEAERSPTGSLALRYVAQGVTDGLVVPAPADPARADELWKTTCFEAFVQRANGEGYYEFNFAPSSRWAAYRFDGYRQGMAPASEIGTPQVRLARTEDELELVASLDLSGADLPKQGPWRLSITAVISETSGRNSYWALAHAAGRPDFHAADGFVFELPVTERP